MVAKVSSLTWQLIITCHVMQMQMIAVAIMMGAKIYFNLYVFTFCPGFHLMSPSMPLQQEAAEQI